MMGRGRRGPPLVVPMSTLALVRGAARVVLLACAGVATIVVPARADAPIVKLFAGPIAPDTPCYPNLDPKYVTAPAGTFVDFLRRVLRERRSPERRRSEERRVRYAAGLHGHLADLAAVQARGLRARIDGRCELRTEHEDRRRPGVDPRRHWRHRDRAVGEGERVQPRLHRQGVGARRPADGARARRHQVPAHQARRPHHHPGPTPTWACGR